ncbi:MAG: LytTR family transcriptional regulator [Clostridiales Family XIII bacterium]|nr:LytTR family transcriptional regulator [Clostridiales Family XIII bacterium]
MRAVVYIADKMESERVANEISRYFCAYHPEYYTRIVSFHNLREFNAAAGSLSMDLYVLQLNDCEASDAGYGIAGRLRGEGVNCALTFIVPSESVAVRVTRDMLRPSYIFVRRANSDELHGFLDNFLSRSGELAFIEFTCRYKKWLVNAENITYIRTCGAKTLIVCTNAAFESTERLADLERRLPKCFFRVDKGCLINAKQLKAVDFTEKKAIFAENDFVYMSRRGAKKLYAGLSGRRDYTEKDLPNELADIRLLG